MRIRARSAADISRQLDRGGVSMARAAHAKAPWFPVLILASAMGPASTDMYVAALPNLQRDLAASESLMQASITACIAGLAIGLFLSGPLSDSWGRRPFLLGGGTAYLVFSV